MGTYYLVFVDDYFSIAPQRDLVLKALKADLGRLGPDDRMAIVAYDGGRLAMLSNWSGSRPTSGAALDQAMARKARGFDRVTEGPQLQRSDQAFASQTVGDQQCPDAPSISSVRQTGMTDRSSPTASCWSARSRGTSRRR